MQVLHVLCTYNESAAIVMAGHIHSVILVSLLMYLYTDTSQEVQVAHVARNCSESGGW